LGVNSSRVIRLLTAYFPTSYLKNGLHRLFNRKRIAYNAEQCSGGMRK
jgi:hypothetical protein